MRRMLLAILVAVPAPALAGELVNHGGGGVIEGSYQIDVDVRGLFATVEARQRVLAIGDAPTLAVYQFELPGDAAVTGFSIAVGTGKPLAGVITTLDGVQSAASEDDGGAIGADRGTMVQVAAGTPRTADDPGTPATYLYTAAVHRQPVTVTTRWTVPVRLEQGRVVIDLPERRSAHLAAMTGTIRFAPIAGLAPPRDVRVGGELVAAAPGGKRTAWTLAAGAPRVIEAEVAVKGTRPVVLADRVSLGTGRDGEARGAIALAIVTPVAAGRGDGAGRLLLLIDTSRSMGRIDSAHVAAAATAVMAAAPATSSIEAIAFDHTATRLLGDWRRNDAAARTAITDKLAGLPRGNGSDLRAALAAAAAAIDPEQPTRIAIISDAGFDLALDADALVAALADRAPAVDVAGLVAVPPGRTAPGHGVAMLAELTRRLGGRVRVARGEALAEDAARIYAESTGAAPWTGAAIDGAPDLALPAIIAPGDGATAVGWYTGAAPALVVTIDHGGKPSRISATAGGADAGALGLARVRAAEELGATWPAAVRAHPVIAAAAQAVVVDATTPLARDRRALIARGAPWARVPSELERADPFAIDAVTAMFASATAPAVGTIDRDTLRNIFQLELLARLRGCYQRALGRSSELQAKATFDLLIGDGELIAATVTGVADAPFRACLVEAAHQLQIPVVGDPTLIRVRYPVDFTVRAEKEYVVLGDADSAEPLDPSLLPAPSTTPVDLDHVDFDDPLGGIPP